MDSFSKLDDALQTLAEIGEGVVVADEQHDGKMKYIVCTEQDCYKLTLLVPSSMLLTSRVFLQRHRGCLSIGNRTLNHCTHHRMNQNSTQK